MLIDESKMAVDSFFSFLNLRKQHTNLKLKLLQYLRLKHKLLSLSKIPPLKLITIDQIQMVKDLTATNQVQVEVATLHTLAIALFRSPTISLRTPTTDTQTHQNCL